MEKGGDARGGLAVNRLDALTNLFFVGEGDPPLGAAAADTGLAFPGVFAPAALAALAFVGFANDDILLGEARGIFDGDADGPACEPSLIFCFFAGFSTAVVAGPIPNENSFFCVGTTKPKRKKKTP